MTNTINKLVFDFTCTSETLARKVQKEIANYAVARLEYLLNNYLETQAIENEIIEIKTLEIDLGNILMDDFADEEILKRVIEELGKKLRDNTKNQEQKPLSIAKSELEIIKSFLLFGDVPWWVDKTEIIDLDTLLKHQFELNFERLKVFFENHQNEPFLRKRLKENFNKSSLELVDKYVFFEQNAPLKQQEHDSFRDRKNEFLQEYHPSQQDIIDSLKESEFEILEKVENEISKKNEFQLIDKIENSELKKNEILFNQTTDFDVLNTSNSKIQSTKNEISIVENQEISQDSEQVYPEKVIKINTVSARNQQSHSTLKITEVAEVSKVDNERILPENNNKFTHIFEQLLVENFSLFQSILEEYFLQNEQKKYPKKFKNSHSKNPKFEGIKTIELIEYIIEHPHFFKYNLWEIINEIDFEKLIERFEYQQFNQNNSAVLSWFNTTKIVFAEKTKKIDFISRIYQNLLPSNDYFQEEIGVFKTTFSEKQNDFERQNYSDKALENSEMELLLSIFKKKEIGTVLEKKIVKTLLQIIPEEVLPIIHFFTQMKEDELALFSSTNSFLNQSKKIDSEEVERIKNIFKNAEGERKIIIENSGICIVSAYLQGFWRNLNYTEGKEFKTVQDACNAVSLIQYMATGERQSQEYLWQFNKLLCGFDIDDFISVKHTISDHDFAEADELLEAVICHWNALKNTSIEGLRTSFFKRKGILTEKENYWLLQIERNSFDLLLDCIPWGFSTIKMPWMKKHIQVEW